VTSRVSSHKHRVRSRVKSFHSCDSSQVESFYFATRVESESLPQVFPTYDGIDNQYEIFRFSLSNKKKFLEASNSFYLCLIWKENACTELLYNKKTATGIGGERISVVTSPAIRGLESFRVRRASSPSPLERGLESSPSPLLWCSSRVRVQVRVHPSSSPFESALTKFRVLSSPK